ncbi:MAG TPA: hypothetical protein VJ576_17665 [Rhodocyclaceae bacterium]|nr:hypothetical protein [Rhodocyclaceae bacterium]
MDTNFASAGTSLDPLQEYSTRVSALQEKLGRILSSNQGTVESLSRAATALRRMSERSQESAEGHIQG